MKRRPVPYPKLTPDQEALKLCIEIRRDAVDAAYRELDAIEATCKHVFRPLSKKQLETQPDKQDFCWYIPLFDEAPDSYKPMESIMSVIGSMVDVDFVMKPVYNFKAGGE